MIYKMTKEYTFLIREKFTDTQLGYVRAANSMLAQYLVETSNLVAGKDYYLERTYN